MNYLFFMFEHGEKMSMGSNKVDQEDPNQSAALQVCLIWHKDIGVESEWKWEATED
jgi:hypothetical protein